MDKIYSIFLEVRRTFHALATLADAIHRDLNVTASQRAVLEALANSSDQTVPGIARGKGVTRQHIQGLANQLLEAGLIKQEDNPAHKRSPFLNLTPAGRKCFAEIVKREKTLIRKMAPKLRKYDLASVAACLRDMNVQIHAVMPVKGSGESSASKTRRRV